MPVISSRLHLSVPLAQQFSTGSGYKSGMGGGQGRGREGILTDGPGVRRLRKVPGHLSVDVKPAESEGDGVRWAQKASLGQQGTWYDWRAPWLG